MAEEDRGASPETDALFPLVYEELKRIAHRHLRYVGGGGATIRTTELVHEAFLKLARDSDAVWDSQAHFFGAASRAMRQVLVDFARRRGAAKRDAASIVSVVDGVGSLELELEQILALDAALRRLDALSPRLRQVVELRFFGGLSEQEIAEIMGVSSRTVERDWLKARMFLLQELEPARGG